MNFIISLRFNSVPKSIWQLTLLLILPVAGAVIAFPGSYLTATNVLVGLCLFPFVVTAEGKRGMTYAYMGVLIIFATLAFRYDIKIFYFFALAFYVIFVLEAFLGKINRLILFLLVVASPVFTQVSVILSFPIRLLLSNWACALLALLGLDARAEGNLILLRGYTFTVDEACMGLSMLAISLLMGVFVISWRYKISKRTLTLPYLLLFFVVLFALNIIANLFRIMLLVVFEISPENSMHDVVGIACLVVYTVVPLYFLSYWLIRKNGVPMTPDVAMPQTLTPRATIMLGILGLVVMITGFSIDPVRNGSESKHANVSMPGMQINRIDGGITKLTDAEVLIYVKPIPEFFTGEHTPLICWQGSGFAFKQVKKEHINGHEIFVGTLAHDNTFLYSAWWYTDGEFQTIDQLTWRTRMLTTGKDFYLVNVTTSDSVTLHKKLEKLFSTHSLVIQMN
ncbi:MAG: exosortase N [Cyclobacteriaceae bacterium]|nr:exosortase N [Cyclobacteriaceae bacterium]